MENKNNEKEHSNEGGTPFRPALAWLRDLLPVLAVPGVLLVVTLLAVTGCSTATATTTDASASTPLCPGFLTRKLDAAVQPSAEDRLDVDVSASFDTGSLGRQVSNLVSDVVSTKARLSVAVIGKSQADLQPIFNCPQALTPKVNDPAAAEKVSSSLVRQVSKFIMQKVADEQVAAKQTEGRAGSALFGALAAEAGQAAAQPLTLVMLTDGLASDTPPQLDLHLMKVQMYGIARERTAGSVDTARTGELIKTWEHVLSTAGAQQPKVVSTGYVAGGVTQ